MWKSRKNVKVWIEKKKNKNKKKTKEESSDFNIISRRLNGEIAKLDESLQDSAENEKQIKVMHNPL